MDRYAYICVYIDSTWPPTMNNQHEKYQYCDDIQALYSYFFTIDEPVVGSGTGRVHVGITLTGAVLVITINLVDGSLLQANGAPRVSTTKFSLTDDTLDDVFAALRPTSRRDWQKTCS